MNVTFVIAQYMASTKIAFYIYLKAAYMLLSDGSCVPPVAFSDFPSIHSKWADNSMNWADRNQNVISPQLLGAISCLNLAWAASLAGHHACDRGSRMHGKGFLSSPALR